MDTYEKKYNEALEVMRQWIAPCHTPEQLEAMKKSVFPELRESEDERIRKCIRLCLDECVHSDIIRDYERDECLAYLEKQKEQKPNPLYGSTEEYYREAYYDQPEKEQNPEERFEEAREKYQVEWSEEDEKMLAAISKALGCDTAEKILVNEGVTLVMAAGFLESLRPSWKPSEDEERLINTSISFLKDFADKGYENAVECIDWLKSKLSGNSGK